MLAFKLRRKFLESSFKKSEQDYKNNLISAGRFKQIKESYKQADKYLKSKNE